MDIPGLAPGSASARAINSARYSGERMPWRKPFIRDRDFPPTVRGPVEFLALRRFASRRASVIVGDFRSGIASATPDPGEHPGARTGDI